MLLVKWIAYRNHLYLPRLVLLGLHVVPVSNQLGVEQGLLVENFLDISLSYYCSFTSNLVLAKVKSLIPVYLLQTQACSPKLE
jgi:hypothetical protein